MGKERRTEVVNIDGNAMRKWCDQVSDAATISREIGFSHSYLRNLSTQGVMPRRVHLMLCAIYNLPADSFISAEPVPYVPAKKKKVAPVDNHSDGWGVRADIDGRRLNFVITKDGVDVEHQVAYIKEEGDLGFYQAVSYAEHMIHRRHDRGVLR